MATPIPYRQIRASFTSDTITVYQAYNVDIAADATKAQKLNASPKFSTTRMTWIKPSWAWMLYRSGYTFKDPGQARILAITLTRASFLALLRTAIVSSHADGTESGVKAKREGRDKPVNVRVQWDPERTVKLDKLGYRSIQIGVPGALVEDLVKGTVSIEDVTDKARELKRLLDENSEITVEELVSRGLVPKEDMFEVDEELRKILKMDEGNDLSR